MIVEEDKVKVGMDLPKALVDNLDAAALQNRRSRTGEVIVRLLSTFAPAPVRGADQAKEDGHGRHA